MFFVPKMVSGYAYRSSKSNPVEPETVMITDSDCAKARFVRFTTIDNNEYCQFAVGRTFYFQLRQNCALSKLAEYETSDIQPHSSWDGFIDVEESHLIDNPLWFHLRGLSETATGYGSKLTSSRMLRLDGRLYRVYVVCYSNSGTAYIVRNGKRIVVH